jgi:hypothetical protein
MKSRKQTPFLYSNYIKFKKVERTRALILKCGGIALLSIVIGVMCLGVLGLVGCDVCKPLEVKILHKTWRKHRVNPARRRTHRVNPEGPWYTWMQQRTPCAHQQLMDVNVLAMNEEPPVCLEGCHDELEAMKAESRRAYLLAYLYPIYPFAENSVSVAVLESEQEHDVPIVCGPNDGECGIIDCDCICHKDLKY